MTEKEYLAPNYDHPTEDDDDDVFEDITEDDAKIEKILDEQAEFNNVLDRKTNIKKEYMNSGFPSFGSGTQKAPWEKEQSNTPRWGGGSTWNPGGGSNSWNNNSWNTQQKQEDQQNTGNSCNKKVVICDVLDCLYESWESNGKPNLLPRGIFDLKPKFEVWDKIASFAPRKLYIIFPAPEIIPSFGNRESAEVTLEYVAQSISTYIRIPRRNCIILKQMQEGLPKEKTLIGALKDWKNQNDMVYIGIHSGRYGLSSRDMDAAHICGIDYIDMYNLLSGRYEFE